MFKFKAIENKKSCELGDNCCSPQPKGKEACPRCGEKAKGVLGKTVEHLLADKAKENLSCFDGFYYCKTPSCEVVYFRQDELLTQKDMIVTVGLKEGASPAIVCYCFDWTKENIAEELEATGKTTALEEIKAKMENPGCSCEILNPSGGCCLGDAGKVIKECQAELN
ncbi:MAG: copper chaperone Copz family protein [Epsilonproteobacteria bacterium]|nr:copper chaperone Copz family protein [Campylobacterota bacterium]